MIDLLTTTMKSAKDFSPKEQIALKRAMTEMVDMTENFSPKRLRRADNFLRKEIQQASAGSSPNHELMSVMKDMRVKLRGSVGEEAQTALMAVDKQYPKYLAIVKAATTNEALADGYKFSPAGLRSAAKKVGGEKETYIGKAPLQDVSNIADESLGRQLKKPLMTARRALAPFAPSVLPVRTINKALLGDLLPQRLARKGKADQVIDALRNYGVSGATTGAAIEE